MDGHFNRFQIFILSMPDYLQLIYNQAKIITHYVSLECMLIYIHIFLLAFGMLTHFDQPWVRLLIIVGKNICILDCPNFHKIKRPSNYELTVWVHFDSYFCNI